MSGPTPEQIAAIRDVYAVTVQFGDQSQLAHHLGVALEALDAREREIAELTKRTDSLRETLAASSEAEERRLRDENVALKKRVRDLVRTGALMIAAEIDRLYRAKRKEP